MKKAHFIASILIILGLFSSNFAQQHTENKADQALRGSGRVNASSLGMELEIPLGSYPGRGINVPISLSYSSKVWRMNYTHTQPSQTTPGSCIAYHNPVYGENSAAGWTTSLAVPYIEYTGFKNTFSQSGGAYSSDGSLCVPPEQTPLPPTEYFVKRINVHLPSGESHELRDETGEFSGNSPLGFDGVYYAADGSNIKYVQNSSTGFYRLFMPDGSFYDFSSALSSLNLADIRKAGKFTDRNGNFTTYNDANGTWTDTLGRVLSAPFGLKAPSAPLTQSYAMPGMTGTYKFIWKKLKGATPAESALTDFDTPLRHLGDMHLVSEPYPHYETRPAGTYLFQSDFEKWVVDTPELFNPVVLTEIELPTGQSYKFSYDYHGRIERVFYPTGGEERFEYSVVPVLAFSEPGDLNRQTNFGVTNRKVYPSAGQSNLYYEWNYAADTNSGTSYKVRITNPDGTRSERYLHRSSNTNGYFGYDSALLGMAYREDIFSNADRLVSRKLTNWTVSQFLDGHINHPKQWHPRVQSEETQIFDSAGNGVSTTTTYEYETLAQRQSPLLMKKSAQYAFVSVGSPLPPVPVRTSETEYLIHHEDYPDWVKDAYKNRNMIGLATSTTVRNGAGTIVSRSETKYDDGGYSPEIGRGNPTTSSIWDSTKGNWDDPNTYIKTRAKFDHYGNQYEAIDARGISTFTEFDPIHHAFPIKVTSSVPDPGNTHGSNEEFITTATFDYVTGLPLTATDANGLETRITYDPVTLRTLNTKTYFQNTPVGSVSETIYHDEPGNYWVKSRSLIDTGKWVESITYFDGLGRAYKAEEINAGGSIFVEKQFDQDGRVKRVTNPFRDGEVKQWTTNVYDESSRIKEVVLPDGAKVKTDYGVSVDGILGITKQITDQAGKKRRGISDALGRMVRVVEDPDGQNLETDYVFDTLGNLRKTIQGEQSRYFTYDSLGRLLRAKQPEQEINPNLALPQPDAVTGHNQWSVAYEYDDNGNITKTTDANGTSVQGTYDNFNRLKIRNYSDETPDVNFYYDGIFYDEDNRQRMATGSVKGKTTAIRSSVSQSNYTGFDNLGRLLKSQQITDGKVYDFSYQYNLTSLISETYPSGRSISYEFDQNGDLARVAGQYAGVSKTYANSFTYNSSGAVESLRLGNGRWETLKYNERVQIIQIGLGSSADDASLLKIDYDYGTNAQNNGSLREQRINFSGLPSEIKQTYTYDDLNRLKSATETFNNGTQSWKQTFVYDRYGNRTFDAANTTTLTQSLSWKTTNPTIQTADNRLKKDQDNDNVNDYNYDKNGSVTLDAENQRFIYDAENRLKQFFKGTNTSESPDGVYFYDGSGQRIKKKTADETVIFVYNASGTLAAEYSTTPAEHAKVSYLTADHLGSPRIITDEAGTVVSRHDYLSFGDEVTDTLGSTANRTAAQGYGAEDEIRKQYTGYERDTESGLDYAKARYYNSKHGRFTSTDPLTASANIRDPQTFNRYSYAMNSPYKYTDPLGLISSSTGANGGNTFSKSCDLACRAKGGGALSKDDIKLLQWHAANGTALGYIWQTRFAKRQEQESVTNTSENGFSNQTNTATDSQLSQNSNQNLLNNSPATSESDNEDGDLVINIVIDIEKGTLEVYGYLEGAPMINKTLFATKIGSGSGDCNNKTSCESKKNKGPTPRGNYTINVNELSEPTFVGVFVRSQTGDWGSFRIPLHPNKGTDTLGRSGFYIHGGDGKGTAGCIDIGGGTYGTDKTRKFTNLLRSSKYEIINVTVK